MGLAMAAGLEGATPLPARPMHFCDRLMMAGHAVGLARAFADRMVGGHSFRGNADGEIAFRPKVQAF
jgi:hypothetical protein